MNDQFLTGLLSSMITAELHRQVT